MFPETKAQEFLESLRKNMCGGKHNKVVDELTTEQAAGGKKADPLLKPKDYTAY